jgi:hypothetical protein
MIRGEHITLRAVQEKDLEILFRYDSDLDNRGEVFPRTFPPEVVFKHDSQQHGFWDGNHRRLVIVDQADTIVGRMRFYQANGYFDALEIGYIVFDQARRNKAIGPKPWRYWRATCLRPEPSAACNLAWWSATSPPSASPRSVGLPVKGSRQRPYFSEGNTGTWNGSRCCGRKRSNSRGGRAADGRVFLNAACRGIPYLPSGSGDEAGSSKGLNGGSFFATAQRVIVRPPAYVGYIPVASMAASAFHVNTGHLLTAHPRDHPRPYAADAPCPLPRPYRGE